MRVTQRCGAPFVREYRRWITPGRTCLTNTWAKPPHHTLLPLHLLWQCCCSPVHPRLCKANSDGNDPTLTTAGRDGETPAGRRSRDSPSGAFVPVGIVVLILIQSDPDGCQIRDPVQTSTKHPARNLTLRILFIRLPHLWRTARLGSLS